MAETQTKSRYQKVKKPVALPGCCFFCSGATGREYFIDTARDVEFHGAIYICNLCIEEMAGMLGFITPDVADKLKIKVGQLESDVFKLTKKEAGLEVAIGGLVAAGMSRESAPSKLDGDVSLSEISTPEPQKREDSVGTGEGTAPEPLDDKGVDKLHPDASSDEPIDFSLNL